MRQAAQDDAAAPGAVGLVNAFVAYDYPACRKVRSGQSFQQLFHENIVDAIIVVDDVINRRNQFLQVVRRDIGRHANGDTGRAIQQQVGQARWENRGFLKRAIEIVDEINGVHVDICQHLFCHASQAGLGITHRCRGIPIDRAKVTLAIYQ